jgi:hypothetical protein
MTDSREANAPAQNDPRQLFDFDLSELPMDRLIVRRDVFQFGATRFRAIPNAAVRHRLTATRPRLTGAPTGAGDE